jgi:hypothetical protein
VHRTTYFYIGLEARESPRRVPVTGAASALPLGRGSTLTAFHMSFSNDLPEMQTYVKFFLEKLGAAFGIAQIFGSITVRFYLHAHRALLEGDSESSDALPVSMVQALGDAENRSEPACDAFVGVAQ